MVTVDVCRTSIRVPKKRTITDYSNPNFETPRHEAGRCETLYYGSPRSHDHLRLYDKNAHLSQARLKIPDAVRASFPSRWVRVERVIRSDRIPQEPSTVGSLMENGPAYDPFSDIEIAANYDDVPPESLLDIAGLKPNQTKNAIWALVAERKYGRNKAGSYLRRNNGDPKKLFSLLGTVLACVSAPMPTPADLTARYQAAFKAQMFGPFSPNFEEILRGVMERPREAYNNAL